MYSTCLFCTQSLGRNDAVEAFPVGRRLAFDAARGRLWVVCPRCERWNLTPLEERWEAIEQCERLFGATRLRVSTEHVGLARLREGLELVRIGVPQRPEMAAWRYGDQFGRRYRKHLLALGGLGVAAAAAVVAGPVMGLVSLPMSISAYQLGTEVRTKYQGRRSVLVPLDDGRTVALKRSALGHVSLIGGLADDPGGEWQLHVPASALAIPASDPIAGVQSGHIAPMLGLTGAAAIRAAGAILPAVNRAGGGRKTVEQAVGLLEETPSPEALFARIAGAGKLHPGHERLTTSAPLPPGLRFALLAKVPPAMRLALEMAAHEEQERRALAGELAELERAWQQAEEVAGIADDLLLPASVDPALDRLRGRASDAAPERP